MIRLPFVAAVILALRGGASATIATDLTTLQSHCGREDDMAHMIVSNYATTAHDSRLREEAGITTLRTQDIRLLTDSLDDATCRRLMASIHERQRAENGKTSRAVPVFYTAGSVYFAVFSAPPPRRPRTPGALYIDSRWVPMYVFDRNFRIIQSLAR
jgi:hypothetical protein